MVAPAGSLPDPMAEVMWTEAATEGFPQISIGEEPMSMVGVEVRQGLLYPGKRRAARETAEASVRVREGEFEELRRQLVREVRAAYARIYAMDRELQFLQSAREMLELLAETTAARYGANEATQESVVKAQLALTRLGEREVDLQADRRVMVAMLGRLLDRRDLLELPPVAELPLVEFPEEPERQALEMSAEVATRRAAIAAAERRLETSRLELKPNLFAAAATYYRAELDPVVTLRFGVEWPLWRREKQLPMIRAAEHELDMAHQELAQTEAMVRERIRSVIARQAQAGDQIRRYREGLIPQSQAALNAARAEYLTARGDFSTVIEDFNMWLEARMLLTRREADLFLAWADIQALVSSAPAAENGGPR
jgi:outer membrane protein TolC